MGSLVRTAVNYGVGDNRLDIDVDVVAPGQSESGGQGVVVARVGIPMARLALLPQGDWYVSRALLFLTVQNAEGDTSPIQEVNVPIRVSNLSGVAIPLGISVVIFILGGSCA